MKKLFAMVALAIFSLAMTSCGEKPEPAPNAPFTLSADKTTVVPGDKIVFTITGDLTNQPIGLCDYITCRVITNQIVNGKYTYTVPADAQIGTFDFYAQKTSTTPIEKTNIVKITINQK